jgi:hypothetical protein
MRTRLGHLHINAIAERRSTPAQGDKKRQIDAEIVKLLLKRMARTAEKGFREGRSTDRSMKPTPRNDSEPSKPEGMPQTRIGRRTPRFIGIRPFREETETPLSPRTI